MQHLGHPYTKKFCHLSEIRLQPRFHLPVSSVPSSEGCSWILMTGPGLGRPSLSTQPVFPSRPTAGGSQGHRDGAIRVACQIGHGALAGGLRSLWTLGVSGEGLRSCPASLRWSQDV